MNLYYAMGGGLGHLTRARAFLHTFGIENNSAILTSSRLASDNRVAGAVKIIPVAAEFENDRESFRAFLQDIFIDLKVETFFIDSFPAGIAGEFAGLEFSENIEIDYVARLLKWEKYSSSRQARGLRFQKAYILEPLENSHQRFIAESSGEQIKIELQYPAENLSPNDEKVFRHILKEKKPFWLIVHAGSCEEISDLIEFADEMRAIENAGVNLILISPEDLPVRKQNLRHFNFYPASLLFEHAERIFTACGFNAMRQAAGFRSKHHFIPFERRFDDQFARAARFRENVSKAPENS